MLSLLLRVFISIPIFLIIIFKTPSPVKAQIIPTATPYPTQLPTVRIISPLNNEVIASTSAVIRYEESGDLRGVDHVHLRLDNQPEVRDLDNDGVYVFNYIQPDGYHSVFVYLAKADHSRFPNIESTARVNFHINIPPTPTPLKLPDLVVTRMFYTSGYGCYTEPAQLSLYVNILNIGYANSGPFDVDVNNVRYSLNVNLARSQSYTLTIRGIENPSQPINVILDPTNQVAEINENNQFTLLIPVPTFPQAVCTPTPTPFGLPDLTVSGIYFDYEYPWCFLGGVGFPGGLRVYISNIGTGNADPFMVNLNGVQKSVSSGLTAGRYRSSSVWFSSTEVPIHYYDHTYLAIADSTNLISESNENNNQYTANYIAMPTPELPCVITITPVQLCSVKSRGDANCDSVTDLIDFEYWRREFTGTISTRNSDFNSDTLVDLVDFEFWRRNFTL